jgi:pimeloyl-ACP methyl ester carboxylesterase
MTHSAAETGYLSGLPYRRFGAGERPLVIMPGLVFENKPQPKMATQMYRFLANDYAVYSVLNRPGLPRGYTLGDMADDYAEMIRTEFGGPVDLLGVSTGGFIAQHFAADHPDLVRRLIIHSSAHKLSDEAKALQLEVARLAQRGQWRQASARLIATAFPQTGIKGALCTPIVWSIAWLMSLSAPQDPSDLVITVEAEDRHSFGDRLAEITAPTLVAAGTRDPFYTPALFRETAAGIANAQLCLYEGMGHPATGKRFRRDVLSFLKAEGSDERAGRV